MEYNNKEIKIATWNLCLGLVNKKDIVTQIIKEKDIDICVMQEIDVKAGYDENLLSFGGYTILVENNDVKSRTGIYVKNGIRFTRKIELEGMNSGLVIIDVHLQSTIRVIGVYRVF